MSVGIVDKQTGDRIPTAGMPAIDDALDLTSVNPVQNAVITAALANKQDKTDNNLETTAKTIVGAINEHEGDISSLKSGLTNLDNEVNGDATTYPYADVITIEDAVPANLADCSVKIEPVQDLHGYYKPWVGGAGKNKLPMTVDGIKAANSGATWTGNSTTINGVAFTILTDNDGNVTGINVNGTAVQDTEFYVFRDTSNSCPFNGMLLNGCINGSDATYDLRVSDQTTTSTKQTTGDGEIINVTATGQWRCSIMIRSGYVASNQMFYPMIRLATETDATFAPYTNICPISGHTEASVQRDGKNLFDQINVETFDATGQGDMRYGHRYNSGTYTIVNNMASESIFVRQVKNDLSEYGQYSTINALNYATINVNDGYMLYVYYQSLTEEQRKNVCVNKGNDTTFAPYQGKTYTIAIGSTIYGGTVDFDSGVMTVDRAIVDLGTLTYAYVDNWHDVNLFYTSVSADMKTTGRNALCSNYEIVAASDFGDKRMYINNPYISQNENIGVSDTSYNDATTFKTAMDGVQLVYELATPTTIQLTPQQIQLLKGQNTLTASTGQISVTVNGVSGSIGAVQEQVNATDAAVADIAEQLPSAPTTDGAYVLTVTVADGTPTYSWVSGS